MYYNKTTMKVIS